MIEIERWYRGKFVGRPKQGTKNPVFLDCRDTSQGSSERRQVILVKPSGDSSLQAREYLGNVLGRAFGLQTPSPVIVEMAQDDLEDLHRQYQRRGWFLGSVLPTLAGAYQVSLGVNLPLTTGLTPDLIEEAIRLFAFDMLCHYADRTPENPNCTQSANGLLVYDFEQGFPEEPRLMTPGLPWSPCGRGLANYHCIYRHISGRRTSLDFLEDGIRRLADPEWRRLVDRFPTEWQPESSRILDYIQEIADHVTEFKADLEGALR